MTESKTISVLILGKEYKVSCEASEVAALQESAAYLDRRMREMKENSNVFGADRLAIMTALNIVNELLIQTGKNAALESSGETMARDLDAQRGETARLVGKIDSELARLQEKIGQ